MTKKSLLCSSAFILYFLSSANAGPLPQTYKGDGSSIIMNNNTLSAQFPSVSVSARPPSQLDDGTSGTPCSQYALWGFQGKYWQNQGCSSKNAHWIQVGNPGLPLDAVVAAGGPMGHCWATFQCTSSYSGTLFTLSNLAGTPNTVNIGLSGTGILGNYAAADNFLANYPQAQATIPDSISGIYVPNEVTATQWNDQTSGTAYNMIFGTGAYTAVPTGGTGYSNSTVVTLTTTGCSTVIAAPTIQIQQSGGVPDAVSLANSSQSVFLNPGTCLNGSFSSSQTEASHTGSETTAASAWTITTYSEGPIWDQYNSMGNVLRGLKFNSVPAALGSNQLAYPKAGEVQTISWTPSTATFIAVVKFDLDFMTQGFIEGLGGTGEVFYSSYSAGANNAQIIMSGNKQNCQLVVEDDPAVFGLIWNEGGSTRVWCSSGNRTATTSSVGATASAEAGFQLGDTIGPSSYLKARLAALLMWPSALTIPQYNAAVLSLTEIGAYNPQTDTLLVQQGDSNYTSGSITEDTAIDQIAAGFNRPVTVFNMAVHGEDLCVPAGTGNTINTDFPRLWPNIYLSNYRQVFWGMNEGANDIRAGNSAANIEACAQQQVAQEQALGSNVVSIWEIAAMQCDIVRSGTELAIALSYDSWLVYSEFVSQASGGLGHRAGTDGLVNLLNDSYLTSTYSANPGNQTVSVADSAYCSEPPGTSISYPNVNSPEGAHQYREFTLQWMPVITALFNSLLK